MTFAIMDMLTSFASDLVDMSVEVVEVDCKMVLRSIVYRYSGTNNSGAAAVESYSSVVDFESKMEIVVVVFYPNMFEDDHP